MAPRTKTGSVPADIAEIAVPATPEAVSPDPAPTPTPAPRLATAFAGSPEQMEKTMEKAFKSAEELVAFGQANVEAFVKAGQIWTAGLQDLSKQVAATAQSNMDETVSTLKALSGVKSLKEAIDLQSTLARANVEKTVAASSQLADASFKLAEQAMAPLTARFQLAAQKMMPAA